MRQHPVKLELQGPRWPELVHPHASAIDTEIPVPAELTQLMLGSTAGWVAPEIRDGDERFDLCPEDSIAEWHERLRLSS